LIHLQCPQCGNHLAIPDAYAGWQGQCQHCGGSLVVPGQGGAPPAPPGGSGFMPGPAPQQGAGGPSGVYIPPQAQGPRPPGHAMDGLIPTRNPAALAAYYMGVFGLIPVVGALLGPAAAVAGVIGWRNARLHPENKGKAHAIVGVVLGALETIGNWGALVWVLTNTM
jgi:hypothetical protein